MGLMERLERAKMAKVASEKDVSLEELEYYDEYESFKESIHAELVKTAASEEGLGLQEVISRLVEEKGEEIPKPTQKRLIQQIVDEAAGLGPLERLLKDDTISEVMVNGPYSIYVERSGKLDLTEIKLRDDKHVLDLINRIVTPIGRRCDEASPMVDARLKDGSRVNAIIPPLALSGPTITIRKFSKVPLRAENLIDFGSASFGMLGFLDACVKARANVVVCGGTGSGKTTLLNILSNFIPEDERIVTIEDSAELQLSQRHTITLESRPANAEGSGRITILDLVRNSLRMRPDRIIVGECLSGETLDMLQALNTGHDGSMTTAHANSSRDLIARLETMVLMAGMELPVRAIREQIASAIDIIVNQSRLKDGSRKIVEISEVVGMEGEVVTLQTLFRFNVEGYDATGKVMGRFQSTGIRPMVLSKMEDRGIHISDTWFA